MARPQKNTVDYFPHDCIRNKNLEIICYEFETEGYAFYYKLFELLGTSEGHFIVCKTKTDWKYLCVQLDFEESKAKEIIALMVDLGVLDAEYWKEYQIIWSPQFCELLEPIYDKRNRRILSPPEENESPQEEEKLEYVTPIENDLIVND